MSLDRRSLDEASANLSRLGNEVKTMRQADAARLQSEYNRLVAGLEGGGGAEAEAAGGGGGPRGGEEDGGMASAAGGVLPASVLAEAVPGNIRNAELFVRYMKVRVAAPCGCVGRGVEGWCKPCILRAPCSTQLLPSIHLRTLPFPTARCPPCLCH